MEMKDGRAKGAVRVSGWRVGGSMPKERSAGFAEGGGCGEEWVTVLDNGLGRIKSI